MTAILVDLSLKLSLLALGAAFATRRTGASGAAVAHRIWLSVLLSPAVLLAARRGAPGIVQITPDAAIAPGVSRLTALIEPWAASVYLVITAVLLARLAVGLVAVRRLVRSSTPLSLEALRGLPGALVAPGLRVGETSLRVPVTAGILRPVILLPRGWRRFSKGELDAVWGHETAHVDRRDYACGLIAALVESLLWFHPAVWFAGRQLRWFAEVAADHRASRGMAPGQYAASLAALADGWASEGRIRYAVTVGAHGAVVRRLHLLVRRPDGGRLPGRTAAVLALVATAGLCLVDVRTVRTSSPDTSGGLDAPEHRRLHQQGHLVNTGSRHR